MGASYSTNEAVLMARGYWVRLLDGDDINSIWVYSKNVTLSKTKKEEFVYGLIYENKITHNQTSRDNHVLQSKNEGLKQIY